MNKVLEKLTKKYTLSGIKRYSFNLSWLMVEKVAKMITGLFVGTYVARYLGPDDFGIMNYVISYVSIFSILVTLGLNEIVINRIVNKPERINSILGTTLIVKILGSVTALVLLGFSFLGKFNTSTVNIYIIIAGISLFAQSFLTINLYFQSQVESKFSVQANLVAIIAIALFKLVLIFTNAPLIWFISCIALESIIWSVGLIIVYQKRLKSLFKWEYDKTLAKNLLSESWPLIFSGIAVMLYLRIDQFMLKEMLGYHEVGIYSAALKLTEMWYFIPASIGATFFPAIIQARKESKEMYYNRFQSLNNLMVVVAFAIAIGMTLFSKFIINTLYGESYSDSATILIVHIWSILFVFFGTLSGKYLIIEGLTKLSLYRTIMGAVINIILNFILIPKYGAIGAAFTTLISHSIPSYFFHLFLNKTRKMFWIQTKALFLIDYIKLFFKIIGLK